MISSSTLKHLRIPFSIFLMPVYLFAVEVTGYIPSSNWVEVIAIFVILHLFIYPASNGYNSYFDKDEEAIGGLEKPPPVSKELYWVSLLFDAVGLLLALVLVGWVFAVMVFIYGIASKGYSHPAVRFKKMPIVGLLIVGLFQGCFTFLMVLQGVEGLAVGELLTWKYLRPGLLSTLLLVGSYPMTQVYQHGEDSRRGDRTLSLMLGIRGTFHFTALVFGLAGAGFYLLYGVPFLVFQAPVMLYFGWWYLKVRKDEGQANFRHTMRLNMLSSIFISLFFLLQAWAHQQDWYY